MTQREFFNTPKDSYPSDTTDESAFKGKTADMLSLGALITGLMVVLSCVTGGGAIYCLPLIPIGLGISALLMKRNAVDQNRTQMWALAGLGSGLVIIVLAVLSLICFAAMIVWLAASTNGY